MTLGGALLRLTLRSARDGRMLARVIEREGTAFVLDYGDAALVAEANRLLHHGGFVVRWEDRLETAVPGSPALLRQLSLHYLSQGFLVFADEPDFPRRTAPPLIVSIPPAASPPAMLLEDPSATDLDTEIVTLSDLRRRWQQAERGGGGRDPDGDEPG